uniref:Centrosomal protein 55 like n=1 Tax=Neogobius melanostomus TaxID=47308 RepID=A0A8C6SX64_9GOBI
MTSKGAKETIASKLGFKSSSSSSPKRRSSWIVSERKTLTSEERLMNSPNATSDRLTRIKASCWRILSLETLRERNNQQLLVREQELETLRQQLTARGGEVVASLQAQLEQRRKDAEQRDALFQSLSQESENLKNKLASVSAHCQSLETQKGQTPSTDMALVQDQLRDALEKNQQWLVYDQQREAYVQSVLARTRELEQQLAQAKPEQAKPDTNSKGQAEAEHQKQQVTRLQSQIAALQSSYEIKCTEMSSLQRKYDAKSKELGRPKRMNEERKVSSERTDRMTMELETMDMRLEEERKRSAELLLQVNMLQKSILSQKEEQMRIAALEQQLSAKEFDNEKIDRQSMQHQLQKVLRELRKARDQIAKLESAKPCTARFSEPSSYNRFEFERLSIDDPRGPTSPSKVINLLDESFLECPKCHDQYPTSRHRELLAHIDYCMA